MGSPSISTAPPFIPPPAGSPSIPDRSPALPWWTSSTKASASLTGWLAPLAKHGGDAALDCAIDWPRRFDHMQQHSGQHLLSAVFEELFALRTVSFHLGAESSTIDLEGGGVDAPRRGRGRTPRQPGDLRKPPLAVEFQDAAEASGLRKASEREGTLRIVSIDGLDRSACGGTHVRATGEIGVVLIRKLERIRQSTRVEFLCGERAVRRARADFQALTAAAQAFSSPLDDVPTLVASQLETARTAEKARRKLEFELGTYQGRELYHATAPGADGIRRVVRRVERGSLDELRPVAQSFTAQTKAVFLVALADPPSVLLSASADSGVDAGRALKAALAAVGGRGGGSAVMAQGSVPDRPSLDRVLESLGS